MNENLAVLSFRRYFLLKSLNTEETQHTIFIYRGFEDHYWENFYCIDVSPSLQARSIIIEEWAITKLFSYQI